MPFDYDSATATANIRAELEFRGLVIGAYDLLLAGQALAMNLILATRNQREFRLVEGLQLENWEE